MYSLDDTVETYYKAFKLNAKHFINTLFPNLLAIYEDISVHFDAWKSRIIYEINLMRLDPDYRVVIDFATKVWNFLAYYTKQLVLSYVFLGNGVQFRVYRFVMYYWKLACSSACCLLRHSELVRSLPLDNRIGLFVLQSLLVRRRRQAAYFSSSFVS